ncbi:hypothetical protein QBC38DRAFT_323705, partial [Podospora fimiseda]
RCVAEVLEECGAPQQNPLILFTDSRNAFIAVMNPRNKARTRCTDIRYKWIIEQRERGFFDVQHMSGKE